MLYSINLTLTLNIISRFFYVIVIACFRIEVLQNLSSVITGSLIHNNLQLQIVYLDMNLSTIK